MTMMLIDSENFRRRCASALTHPVTLAALVALLLNDGLFKSLWPDAWVTGKLSDLAWVVFASPLLAFVLSLFLSRRLFGRRATIIIAYVGLPALLCGIQHLRAGARSDTLGIVAGGRRDRRISLTRPTRWSFHLAWVSPCGYGAGGRSVLTG